MTVEEQVEQMMADEYGKAIDAWIDAIPENVYDPCPCGCGKKFRFAIKEGIEPHMHDFMKKFTKK